MKFDAQGNAINEASDHIMALLDTRRDLLAALKEAEAYIRNLDADFDIDEAEALADRLRSEIIKAEALPPSL